MIFLNEANSVKELISTEMLRLRKTIPGRERSVGPLIRSVTLAVLAYIICLHLHCQRTQTPSHTFPPIDFFSSLYFFVWLILRGGGTLFSSASFSQSGLVRLLKTVWRQSRAAQRGWNAIGRFALLPRVWLAAGFHVGFNQLCGSVCRSVCSDVSILFPSSTEFFFFLSFWQTGCCVNWLRSKLWKRQNISRQKEGRR